MPCETYTDVSFPRPILRNLTRLKQFVTDGGVSLLRHAPVQWIAALLSLNRIKQVLTSVQISKIVVQS